MWSALRNHRAALVLRRCKLLGTGQMPTNGQEGGVQCQLALLACERHIHAVFSQPERELQAASQQHGRELTVSMSQGTPRAFCRFIILMAEWQDFPTRSEWRIFLNIWTELCKHNPFAFCYVFLAFLWFMWHQNIIFIFLHVIHMEYACLSGELPPCNDHPLFPC